MIIAIDGPAGSGKSSTAREVAARLGFVYLDTGAMYRAVALAFLRAGVPFEESRAISMVQGIRLRVESGADGQKVFLDDEDVSLAIRESAASMAASEVSRLECVRSFLVSEQRRIAQAEESAGRGVVMEGRDIGTVVFPQAGLKVFLTADPSERTLRRMREYEARGEQINPNELRREIDARDARDSGRALSPLRPADDAVLLDTTGLGFTEQVERIVALARERGL